MQVAQEQQSHDVPLEPSDVYVRMGLPHPFEAYQRALKNAQFYVRGKWVRTWWQHRIEPLAATGTGISLLKEPTSYGYKIFLQRYANLAANLDATHAMEVDVCASARRRQLSQAEQVLRIKKLKEHMAAW